MTTRCSECNQDHGGLIPWHTIEPKDAISLDLTARLDIDAPRNEEGERCPWPWEPQQLVNAPLGQFHCCYCGAMVLAGIPHLDYGPEGLGPAADETQGGQS